ncbi:FimV/HubP family polar landmark protein [Salinisphaera aquimarina]|uniref:FimV/HubP family polar landmark protein n=1 Tax=Salinisphaera aquimarina TaxID=2094031 RepID=A0ABV7ESG1_9GAMM
MFDTKLRNKRCIAAAGLVWLLCHAGGAFALGFGEIRVNSSLNEPLDATLTLVSLSDAEQSSLSVGVASPDMFKRFGIERTSLDDELRVDTAQVSGSNNMTVRLTTRRPVREPFLRFLIEANSSEGKALREYTVLLDPPTRSPRVAATPTPTPATAPSAPRRTAPASPAPRRATAPRAAVPAPSATTADTYGPVARGDTLFSVATQTRRPGTTQDQMQVAIFRDNPQAFGGNMNVLLRGAMLSIPPVESITAIGESEARAQIAENRRSATPPSTRTADTAQSTGKTTAADATQPPAMTQARLRLEPPRLASDTTRAANGAFFGRLVEPDFSATTAPSSSPISSAQAAETVPSAAQGPVAGAAPQAADPEPAPPVDAAMGEGATADSAMTQSPDAVSTAAEPSAGATAQDSTAAAAAPAVGDDDAALPISAGERDVVGRSGAGLFRPLNLLLLLAAAALLLLLLLWNRRRQYKTVQLDFDPDDAEADDVSHTPAAAAPAPQDNEIDTPPGVAAGPAPAAVAGVAPLVRVQDADRQMKLGLFDGARTTLENGLAQTPTDAGLQDKLLERDYLAGDATAFEHNVTRFDAQLSGNGVRWAGVAAMGRILLPHDPRFVAAGRMATPSQASGSRSDAATTPQPPAETAASTLTPAAPSDDVLQEDLESIMDEPAKPAAEDFFADDTVVAPVSVTGDDQVDAPGDDDTLSLDTGAAEAGEYNWQPQEVSSGGERQHDRGDEPGMAFELDTSDFPDDRQRPPIEPEPPKSHAFAPIDTSEFDLGDESPDDDGDFGAGEAEADAVDIRIDLARMYLDMEDQQAARELLEEALGDGNEAQRSTARELLDSL